MGGRPGYERPYTGRQMLEHGYDPALVRKLMADPVHKWRAKTGIELVHREPDLKEAIRVWVNWNRMSAADKAKSDRKSRKLFGVDNKAHYEQLRPLYKESQACLRGFLSTLAKCAAATTDRASPAPQTLTPPPSVFRAPLVQPPPYTVRRGDTLFGIARRHGSKWWELAAINGLSSKSRLKPDQTLTLMPHRASVPAPRPAPPIQATVPRMGLTYHGYGSGSATLPAHTFGVRGVSGVPAPRKGGIRDATADRAASGVRDAGSYAMQGLNYLASLPEFQRRVGGGDVAAGRKAIAPVARDLAAMPIANETPAASGPSAAPGPPRAWAAMAYTRPGNGSYVAMPARTILSDGTFRGSAGKWRRGIMAHEVSHPFTIKLPGYLDKIRRIQQEEGIQGTDQYHRTPTEQAAEFNAVRMLNGAWPGQGAGPGGKYTPGQADAILNSENPYFRGLPAGYKARLLNEARNRRAAPAFRPARRVVA